MLLLKYVTLIIFKFGKDILMKKELKRFTFKPVALQYLNDNDGFFYANLQESVNELCQILDLKKKPYIYIYPRNINLYDGTRGLHITKKYTPSMIFVRFDALAYCRLLSSRCNDSKNEWYKTPEEFGPDVYALSDEYAEKFDLPKSNQAN